MNGTKNNSNFTNLLIFLFLFSVFLLPSFHIVDNFINVRMKKLSLLAIATIPFFIFAPEIFGFIFGERWIEAGKYIRILSPWIILIFIDSSFATLPYIYHRQKKSFIIEAFYLLAKLVPFFVLNKLNNIYLILLLVSLISSFILIYTLAWYLNMIKKDSNNDKVLAYF